MKVYLGSDHTGFEFKKKLITYLSELGYEAVDCGASSYDADDDYPDFVKEVAKEISQDPTNFGIILGGSGQGEAMCANRFKGVRAMTFYGPKEPIKEVDIAGQKSSDTFELVKLARIHNNANVLSIGTRFATEDEAKFAIELFLTTKFPGEERHIRRIAKLD